MIEYVRTDNLQSGDYEVLIEFEGNDYYNEIMLSQVI